MAKLAPYVPMQVIEHYRERIKEIGRLAARLDSDDRHPCEILIDFFELDKNDQAIMLKEYASIPLTKNSGDQITSQHSPKEEM